MKLSIAFGYDSDMERCAWEGQGGVGWVKCEGIKI